MILKYVSGFFLLLILMILDTRYFFNPIFGGISFFLILIFLPAFLVWFFIRKKQRKRIYFKNFSLLILFMFTCLSMSMYFGRVSDNSFEEKISEIGILIKNQASPNKSKLLTDIPELKTRYPGTEFNYILLNGRRVNYYQLINSTGEVTSKLSYIVYGSQGRKFFDIQSQRFEEIESF
jgi:hypothetical protein